MNKKQTVSDDLINITFKTKEKQKAELPSEKDYTIVLEDDGYYKITLYGETIIHTKVSEKLLNDLTLFGIIPEDSSDEDKKIILEAYLIRAAKEFTNTELHKKKQDGRGKIDVAGIDDEF